MSEKTEAPTGKRISDARQEGQVARSHELNAAAALIVGGWLLTGPGRKLFSDLSLLTVESLSGLPQVARAAISGAWLRNLAAADALTIAADLGVICLGMLLTGVVATLAQTGFLWASKRIGFDFKRVNPLTGFKRIFSPAGLVEMVKALLKLLVVGWVGYSYLQGQITELIGMGQTELRAAAALWVSIASSLVLRVGGAYFILAAADYAYQRWNYNRTLKMTKEEVKEEMKTQEGDPMLKGRIRGQQRRMARMRMMSNVKKADVIITNPTHLAIAIQYDAQSMRAPIVLAKGAHLTAQRIVDLAKQSGIPVVQNIPLARAMYRTVEIDQEVPPELYLALAEVLAYVYRLKGKLPVQRPAAPPAGAPPAASSPSAEPPDFTAVTPGGI